MARTPRTVLLYSASRPALGAAPFYPTGRATWAAGRSVTCNVASADVDVLQLVSTAPLCGCGVGKWSRPHAGYLGSSRFREPVCLDRERPDCAHCRRPNRGQSPLIQIVEPARSSLNCAPAVSRQGSCTASLRAAAVSATSGTPSGPVFGADSDDRFFTIEQQSSICSLPPAPP